MKPLIKLRSTEKVMKKEVQKKRETDHVNNS